ncbi:MAG: hypothetical protein RL204_1270, partial [Bacteroidota bacterium]
KKLLSIIFIVFLSLVATSQVKERFTVKGSAKLIASWTGQNGKDASGVLSTGDKITINYIKTGIYVTATHKNVAKQILALIGFEKVPSTEIKIYEYDFDSDGQQEIIIVHSPDLATSITEVFTYSNGLAKKVGKFNGEYDIILEKNSVSFPLESKGPTKEYIYKNSSFYELVYHDPNKD